MSTSAPQPRRSAWPWALVALAVVAASLFAFVFWRIETWPARTAADVASVFDSTFQFQPQITVDEQVMVEQVTRTAELATAQRQLVVERDYSNRWLLSTKRLRARGTYTAKAGFDLRDGVDVRVDKGAGAVSVRFPAPQMLSLAGDRVDFLEWDNGLWNRLNGTDAQQAVAELRQSAERRAHDEGLLADAKRSLTDQLSERLAGKTGLKVNITFADRAERS